MFIAIFVLLWTFVGGQTQSQNKNNQQGAPRCSNEMIGAYDCLERIRNGDDTRMLAKRKDEIFDRCVQDLPDDCTNQRRAQDRCEHELLHDKFQLLQKETKHNLTACFKRYPINNQQQRRGNMPMQPNMGMPGGGGGGGGGGGAGGGWGGGGVGDMMGAMQQPSAMMSPESSPLNQLCAPSTPEQMQCIQRETRFLEESTMDIAGRLQAMQRECLMTAQLFGQCRLDTSPQLRECVRVAEQTFMRKSASEVDACMQRLMSQKSTTGEDEEEASEDTE